ncbi:MAG TPA: GPO family capsid scaffolding protein [Pedomonas sp.]|uniref:GPO family capsid scaffolding protein n=1 Tax=Pedomonas sp. TaxID=2976421 RepID=UPI002F3ECBB3
MAKTRKTKFTRIAVEGATTDGRVIERDWIEQMAATYDPATYTARVNCEHIRGFSPTPPFNAYGSVTALKTEEVELSIGGKKQKRLALLAQIEGNEQLIQLVEQDQKRFTSIEVSPNFAETGKAGLVGLALTDNPASLGTEALQFSALKPMWDARKADPNNLFTAALETEIAFEDEAAPAQDMATVIKGFVTSLFSDLKPGTTQTHTPPQAPAAPAQAPANDNDALIEKMSASLGSAIEQALAGPKQEITALRTDLTQLTQKLSQTETPGQARQLQTGGTGDVATDC